MNTPSALANAIRDYVRNEFTALLEQYAPDGRFDGVFGGFATGSRECADAAYTLSGLRALGVEELGHHGVDDLIRQQLARIDGPSTNTFYSYRTGEVIAAGGGFDGHNPLLRGLSNERLRHLREACDSTDILDADTQTLKGLPNNYWGVLARCEAVRGELGLLEDGRILRLALDKTLGVLEKGTYMDDDRDGGGRYDIYSFDMLLFLEPLWDRLGRDAMRDRLRRHIALLDQLVLENGATVVWGRSTGALSVCLGLELAATALAEEAAADPARILGLARQSFLAFPAWMRDHLIDAHRHRSPYAYRGPARLLQMTLDCWSKLLYAARQLQGLPPTPTPPRALDLYPPVDHWEAFERERPLGVRMVRGEGLCFQLPVVAGSRNADYAAFPHWPGVWDVPVDSESPAWLPRFRFGETEYIPHGVPVSVEQKSKGLRIRYASLRQQGGSHTRPAELELSYDWADGELGWHCAYRGEPMDQVALVIPESQRPLRVRADGGTPGPRRVPVSGSSAFRSFWGEIQALHEVQWRDGGADWRGGATIRPLVRVLAIPGDHDYVRTLYDAIDTDWIRETPHPQGIAFTAEKRAELLALAARHEVLHLGWPEHLFTVGHLPWEDVLAGWTDFLEGLDRIPCRVVWTMHNRVPHAVHREHFGDIYALLARRVDAALHHSDWGRKDMLARLPFRKDCQHALIPHPHFGKGMACELSRAEVEARYQLPPCAIRFAVYGRPQADKRVDLILRAFAASKRRDDQLLVTAWDDKPVPVDDPRVQVRPRKGWLTREDIARDHVVSDVLISAHQGESYLTSGLVADAVGVGIPMVVPDWAFFREILGEAGLYYDGTETGLRERLDKLTTEDLARAAQAAKALQAAYAPEACAAKVLGSIQQMLGVSNGPSCSGTNNKPKTP